MLDIVLIYHVATVPDWEQAQAAGSYRISTLGRTLEQEGFIHASRHDQWRGVLDRFYAGVTTPLVLLAIDTDRLAAAGVPVVEEQPAPGVEQTFPHLYAALPVDAVVDVRPVTASSTGSTAGGADT